jgi:hypothetical protein
MPNKTSGPRRRLGPDNGQSVGRGGTLDSPTQSFRSALIAAHTKFDEPAIRAHIDRWLSSADDPVWQKTVVKMLSSSGKNEPTQELIENNYWWIIYMGLRGRRAAEQVARTGEDPENEYFRASKAHLLKLASAAEYLSKEYA